jgi:predicted nucleic acid-binding protein
MGKERTEKSVRRAIVLDAGGLIAFERASEGVAALIEHAAKVQAAVLIPASALAQVWRGGPRSARLAQLVANAESDPLDEARAKEVGKRLGDRAKTDIADAHVVCCALAQNAAVVTSDRDDIEALAQSTEKLVLVSI